MEWAVGVNGAWAWGRGVNVMEEVSVNEWTVGVKCECEWQDVSVSV